MPGGEQVVELKPDREAPTVLGCAFHFWMKGYVWALDTPYAAVTDKEGRFAINGIPAGEELQMVAWHEQPGFLFGVNGKAIILTEGENVFNFTIKAKELPARR